MPFHNRVRLPIYASRPSFPIEKNVFRLANGTTQTQSVVVRKLYEVQTDWIPEEIHERLVIALTHDSVTLEGQKYLGGIVLDADVEISWVDFLDYPLAKAAFKVEVTPYDVTNDNCQSCEEATQLALEDDTITGVYDSLAEGSTTEYNVFANDSICCTPITAEIVTINNTYVDSATIDATSGVVEIILHATTPSGTNVNLLTYRVTCPNGSYDDADVFANISGSEEACLPPGSLDAGTVGETSATPNWFDLPEPNPESYNYALYLSSDLFTPIDSGNTDQTSVNYTNLVSRTCYTFFLQSVCPGGGTSEFISIEFCTAGTSSETCGQYELFYNDPDDPTGFIFAAYRDCDGVNRVRQINHMGSVIVCALQTSPANPVHIIGATSWVYLGLC